MRARARATRCRCPPESAETSSLNLVGEIHEGEGAGDLAADRVCSEVAQRKSKTDVLGDVHVRKERVILKHRVDRPVIGAKRGYVAPVEQHTSLCRLLEAGDHSETGRFTATGGAKESQKLALRDLEVDVVEGGRAAGKHFRYRIQTQKRLRRHCRPRTVSRC